MQTSDPAFKDYLKVRKLEDGRIIAVGNLLFHYSLYIDLNLHGYEYRYCYPDLEDAMNALETWSGQDDPPGFWNRHPNSGRRRDRSGKEWIMI